VLAAKTGLSLGVEKLRERKSAKRESADLEECSPRHTATGLARRQDRHWQLREIRRENVAG
jgi:hypothetical protein